MDKDFWELLEKKWVEIQAAEWSDAPFPMDEYEAMLWNRGRRELMQWVIEMMPVANKP
jgi:hypothetical protein